MRFRHRAKRKAARNEPDRPYFYRRLVQGSALRMYARVR
jgi:hypothetical protein